MGKFVWVWQSSSHTHWLPSNLNACSLPVYADAPMHHGLNGTMPCACRRQPVHSTMTLCVSANATCLLLTLIMLCKSIERNSALQDSCVCATSSPAAVAAPLCVAEERFRGKMVVILAGYEAQVDELMTLNPGLKSRFSEKLHFPGFDAPTACRLLAKQLSKNFGLELSPAAADAVQGLMQQVWGDIQL